MPEQVLVTGASGFVGAATVRALPARSNRMRALVRHSSPRHNLAGLPVEIVTGDLCDALSLQAALAGCSALIHCAADYRLWVPAPADENTPSSLAGMIGLYKRSKYQTEKMVRGLMAEQGLPAVIVNPSPPVGPGDIRPTPAGRVIVEAASGRMHASVETGLNIVHVDDVAFGHVLALERGQVEQRYILGGDNLRLSTLLTKIAILSGRKPPRWRVPLTAVMPVAMAAEGWGRIAGRKPFITMDGPRMTRHPMFFSSAKAERLLGYRHRPAEQALAVALAWFRDQGFLS